MLDTLRQQISAHQPFDEREKADREAILDFISKNDDCLLRDNKVAHFTTSAWLVNPARTKVLMVHHNIYNSWVWVGGHADGESDLFQVIKREIEEETGLKHFRPLVDGIYGLSILLVDGHIKNGEFVNSHLHLNVEYLLEADDSLALKIKPDENSGVKWVDIDKINNTVALETDKPIYARLMQKMLQYKY